MGIKESVFKKEFIECGCFYCDGDLRESTATREHLIAKTQGGTHDLDNTVVACQSCNAKAGRKSLSDKFNMAENERYKQYMVYMYPEKYSFPQPEIGG
jgi:5-methylcytosine-specific restriction endonuclease McrA